MTLWRRTLQKLPGTRMCPLTQPRAPDLQNMGISVPFSHWGNGVFGGCKNGEMGKSGLGAFWGITLFVVIEECLCGLWVFGGLPMSNDSLRCCPSVGNSRIERASYNHYTLSSFCLFT